MTDYGRMGKRKPGKINKNQLSPKFRLENFKALIDFRHMHMYYKMLDIYHMYKNNYS